MEKVDENTIDSLEDILVCVSTSYFSSFDLFGSTKLDSIQKLYDWGREIITKFQTVDSISQSTWYVLSKCVCLLSRDVSSLSTSQKVHLIAPLLLSSSTKMNQSSYLASSHLMIFFQNQLITKEENEISSSFQHIFELIGFMKNGLKKRDISDLNDLEEHFIQYVVDSKKEEKNEDVVEKSHEIYQYLLLFYSNWSKSFPKEVLPIFLQAKLIFDWTNRSSCEESEAEENDETKHENYVNCLHLLSQIILSTKTKHQFVDLWIPSTCHSQIQYYHQRRHVYQDIRFQVTSLIHSILLSFKKGEERTKFVISFCHSIFNLKMESNHDERILNLILELLYPSVRLTDIILDDNHYLIENTKKKKKKKKRKRGDEKKDSTNIKYLSSSFLDLLNEFLKFTKEEDESTTISNLNLERLSKWLIELNKDIVNKEEEENISKEEEKEEDNFKIQLDQMKEVIGHISLQINPDSNKQLQNDQNDQKEETKEMKEMKKEEEIHDSIVISEVIDDEEKEKRPLKKMKS